MKEAVLTIKIPELKDRFMELMEKRHEGALVAMEIERILGEEIPDTGEYPTIVTSDSEMIEKKATKALEPILQQLEREHIVRGDDSLAEDHLVLNTQKRVNNNARAKQKIVYKEAAVLGVVGNYLNKKVEAKRAELKLKTLLAQRGIKTVLDKTRSWAMARLLGKELFKLKTKNEPRGLVQVERIEGYLLVYLSDAEDYKNFKGSARESGGEFHRAIRSPEVGADLLIIYGNRDKEHRSSIVRHERQHFINHSMFTPTTGPVGEKLFGDIENASPLGKKMYYSGANLSALEMSSEGYAFQRMDAGLRAIKDEVLAYIRGGSSSIDATNFIDDPLYAHLKRPFHQLEMHEVDNLMRKIRDELTVAFETGPFGGGDVPRGILVYHLIDIPLIKFPERIRAVVRFYETKGVVPGKD
ncbi:MAG: hypothetical protein HZA94_03000 [Candidatus Vogelbacteria bacterium]|nr:hypothetical protein [Candidatus Vogelbacteria bacterium]